jgi:hypothetical protein
MTVVLLDTLKRKQKAAGFEQINPSSYADYCQVALPIPDIIKIDAKDWISKF